MVKPMENKSITLTYEVTADKTAERMGSGDMPVLATPAMVAMMENAAMTLAGNLCADGDTTVGSLINTTHQRPSAVGATISVRATLTGHEGRKLTFAIEAKDGDNVIGVATHERFIVTRDRFLAKLGK